MAISHLGGTLVMLFFFSFQRTKDLTLVCEGTTTSLLMTIQHSFLKNKSQLQFNIGL